MRILVVNAGSSSVKIRLLGDADEILGDTDLDADASGFDAAALTDALGAWPAPDVVAHRVVHGGPQFVGAVRVNDDVLAQLRALTVLAPLHQPKALDALEAVRAQLPGLPTVACFDTAFHAGLPAEASTYAVPQQWREQFGVRRYGFHGLSHAYASRRAAQLLGRSPAGLRLVTCHLGAGASLCAVVDGRSVDTTMGFTPLEGLVMATRSGTVDPGMVLWLQQQHGLDADDVSTALEQRSGLTGLAGTADMRQILTRADAGDADAQLALGVYLHRLASSIAAMTASAGGVDALVFTGGVGEHSAPVRAKTLARLGWLGADVGLDAARNAAVHDDADVGVDGAAVRTLVVAAREDLQIARETRALLAG